MCIRNCENVCMKYTKEVGFIEKHILHAILPGHEVSLTFVYLQTLNLLSREKNKTVPVRDFRYHHLKSLVKKELIKEIVLNKEEEPLYKLTSHGKILRDYFFPFSGNRKETTIFVLPEVAAKETGYSLNSIYKKRIQNLNYIVIKRRLFILKRTEVSYLISSGKVPFFPLIKNYSELVELFPDPYGSLLPFFEKHKRKEGWIWNELFTDLLLISQNSRKPLPARNS